MCVCVGAFMIVESPECDIFSSILPPTFSPDSAWLIPLLLFQASNLKFALPVVSIHRLVKQKLRGATQWLTCLSLSSFTLRMHTNAKHCSTFFFFFFNRIFFSIFCRRSLFWGDTHAHLCVPRCRSNHVLVSNLQTWNQVSRTVTCFTYIASFVLTVGK